MNCFRAAAVRLDLALVVHAADLAPDESPVCQLGDMFHAVPSCDDDRFVPELFAICAAFQIEILIPTIDPELLPLASGQPEFEKLGVDLVLSGSGALSIARNKLDTADRLGDVVPVPRTVALPADPDRLRALGDHFVIKPVDGSSSYGLKIGASLSDATPLGSGYIAQEQLRGREHTVNCFVDRSGRLLAAVPHERLAVRSGEVSKGRTVRSPALQDAAEAIVGKVPGLRGPFCFQAFMDGDQLAGVFEINARFGGGYPLADRAGASFAEWILLEHLGLPLPGAPEWREGVTMLRYDQSVFAE